MRRGDLREESINAGSDEHSVFRRCGTREGLGAVARCGITAASVNGVTMMGSCDGSASGLQNGECKDSPVQSIRRRFDLFDEVTQEGSDIGKIREVEIVLEHLEPRVEPC
jgi:hypothetical protein